MWGGLLFLLAVIGSLVFTGVRVSSWMEDEQRAPVQVIDFSGYLTHIDVLKLERLIRQEEQGSFFSLDVNKVHELLEAQPWVYRASVRKQWPNKLKIYLVEQEAVAHWNDDLLLNKYGESFATDGVVLTLPNLYGPGGSELTALEGFNAMQQLLVASDLSIDTMFLSERFAWNLELSQGLKLNLGRTEFIDRLQRFIDVYPLLQKEQRAISYVDLRYDTGLAVGWSDIDNK